MNKGLLVIIALLGLSIIGNVALYNENRHLVTQIQHLQEQQKTRENSIFELMREKASLEQRLHYLQIALEARGW